VSHLNSKVVGLNIQMSFSNDPGLPKYVGDVGPETDADSVMRSLECSGELVLGPTENVGLERLLEDLSSVGFCLVDAFHQERVRRNVKPGQKSTYHMVRYHFVREDKAVLNDESREFVRFDRPVVQHQILPATLLGIGHNCTPFDARYTKKPPSSAAHFYNIVI